MLGLWLGIRFVLIQKYSSSSLCSVSSVWFPTLYSREVKALNLRNRIIIFDWIHGQSPEKCNVEGKVLHLVASKKWVFRTPTLKSAWGSELSGGLLRTPLSIHHPVCWSILFQALRGSLNATVNSGSIFCQSFPKNKSGSVLWLVVYIEQVTWMTYIKVEEY